MTSKKDFTLLQQDYLERKIFLKRQLIRFTEKEIEALEKERQNPGSDSGSDREARDVAQRAVAL